MRIAIVLTFLLSITGCGIKGKPLPPLTEEPVLTTEEKTEAVSQPTKVQPLKTLPAKKKSK